MSNYRSRLLLNQPGKKEYTFLSRGAIGIIRKIVELERADGSNIFNVLLVDEINGRRMDDTDLTGNNDALKVINTVVRIIEKFFVAFPGNVVFISGNTLVKRMMYQRKVYLMNETKYLVLANRRNGQPFTPIQRPVNTGTVYNAFLVYPV